MQTALKSLTELRERLGQIAALILLGAAHGPPAGAVEEPPFIDQATELGLDFVHFNGMSGELYFAEMTGQGGAFLDYDGDGDLDVYLVQGHMLGDGRNIADATFPPRYPLPLSDRLYRNDLAIGTDGIGEPRFVDVTEAIGLEAPGYGMGVATGDYDNDGWIDLYVTNLGPNQMLRNNGDGTFTDTTRKTGTGDPFWGVSAAFFDYDRDGWLDVYVGNYVDFRLPTHKPCYSATGLHDYCGPKAYNPEPDRLFRNRGDGTFEDASFASRVGAEKGAGLGVVSADFNGDRWLDLYVANDGMANFLWLNQQDGTFVNDAVLGGCAVNEEGQPEASMGVVAGDINGDGFEDLFMTHLTRESNTLYLNDGQGMFRESTRESGLGMTSWQFTGFGTALIDYDNNGWLDLFVANGAVLRIEDLVRLGDPYALHQKNLLFRNLSGSQFENISAQGGEALGLSEVSRGVAIGDVDNDGDSDLLVINNAGPVRLLMNQSGQRRPWLGLRLREARSGRDLLGSKVKVQRRGAPPLWRRVATDGSYASAGDPRLIIGLGDSEILEQLHVLWPDGADSRWQEPPSRRLLVLPHGLGGHRP